MRKSVGNAKEKKLVLATKGSKRDGEKKKVDEKDPLGMQGKNTRAIPC